MSSPTFSELNVMVSTHTPRIACQRVNVSAGKATMALLVRPERERERERDNVSDL